jgi:hypothetical protein
MITVRTDHHPGAPPSELSRIAACPASMALCATVPPETSDDADEGRLLHAHLPPAVSLDDLNEEQKSSVLWAREYIAEKTQGADRIVYEQARVLWLDGEPVTWGTLDVEAVFDAKPERVGSKVIIVDPKFGRNQVTRETCGLQIMCYAGAALQEWAVDTAEVFVCQPRTLSELKGAYSDAEEIAREVKKIIDHAKSNPAEYHTSPDACRYCRAKLQCSAFREEILLPAERTNFDAVPVAELTRALEAAPLLEAYVFKVRKLAREMLAAGVEVPGYTLGEKKMRHVVDVDRLYGSLADVMPQRQFLECCKVQLTDLERLYGALCVQQGLEKSVKAGMERFARETSHAGSVEIDLQKYLKKEKTE